MHTTYRPSIFSVFLQLKDLIRENNENIQIKLKLLAKLRVFNIIFRKAEHGDVLVLLAC